MTTVGYIVAAAAFVIALVIGFPIGIQYRKKVAEKEISSAEDEAKRIINEAIKSAEGKKREALLEAKEEILKKRKFINPEPNTKRKSRSAEPTCKSRSAVCSRRKRTSIARPMPSRKRRRR